MFERNSIQLAASPRGVFLAVAGAVILGCGGGASPHKETTPQQTAAAKTAKGVAAKKPAREVKPAALREFDAGLRALKLGGPEANERAAESFERAVAADPTMWEAWHDLGVVRARSGDDRKAAAAFGKALEAKPGHIPSLVARAEASRRLGKRGDAKGDYEAALKIDPEDVATRLRLASLQRESGDTDGSVKTVREVLRRNPQGKDLADANVELGLCYLAAGREELAELVLGKAANVDAKNPKVWNALGLLALKQGKDQESFQRFDHATNLDPSFRDARFNKAAVLLDAGDYAQAKSELTAALKGQEDGADLDALVALGVAERGLGEYPRASATWERVLRVAPQNADALYNLAVLNMDFTKDEGKARDYLSRYRSAASDEHPRYKEAQSRMDQLGPSPQAAAPPPVAPQPKAPPPKAGGKPKAKPRRRRRLARRAARLVFLAATLLGGSVAVAAPAKKAPAKPAPAQAKPTEVTVERTPPAGAAAATGGKKEKTFDFTAMGIEGRVLAPQLMYLLGRIKVELERGDLEGRSFVPELVRSVDEGGL